MDIMSMRAFGSGKGRQQHDLDQFKRECVREEVESFFTGEDASDVSAEENDGSSFPPHEMGGEG